MQKGVRVAVDVDMPRTCSGCGRGLPHHVARVEVFTNSNLHPALVLCPLCAVNVGGQILFAAGQAAERQENIDAQARAAGWALAEVR